MEDRKLKGPMHFSNRPPLDLPESIVALILSHTTPGDVARLALVNRAFRDASRTNLVWERMLPDGYQTFLKLGNVHTRFSSKRELYDRLCNHILLGDGSEGVWIDRKTGEVCHSFSSRSLAVTWGSTAEYWEWSTKQGARFEEVAHLKMVCWLELSGRWTLCLRPGTYTVSWRLQLDGDAFGWEKEPVRFSLATLDGRVTNSSCYLVEPEPEEDGKSEDEEDEDEPVNMVAKARSVGDNWVEYDVGEVSVEDEDGLVELFFSMQEIASGTWKGGLYIDGVVIQPSHVLGG